MSSDSSDSDSEYDSESSVSSSDDSDRGSGDEEEDNDQAGAEAAAKKERIHTDIDEMHRMMADMDAIKLRLQQRFATERQVRAERLAREGREREVQEAARRKAQENAHSRQVEASVQTEGDIAQQQMEVSQRNVCPPHLADSAGTGGSGTATLPAVDGGQGVVEAVPNKVKPAGLSLYDLVKTTGFDLSPKIPSPAHQADPPEILPMRSSHKHEQVSPFNHERQQSGEGRDWNCGGAQLSIDQDSVVGDVSDDVGYITPRQTTSMNSARSYQQLSEGDQSFQPSSYHDDENVSSVSNSLISSDDDNRSAVVPDLTQRQDHKFNAAALLNTSKRSLPSTTNYKDDSKTDEQREMEAIQ
ncbi:Hypothetical protein PHPALM_3852 [Phytophthora palmivora]|uniref:Uncharacterized protein n=1 Tax=Phytophthora palmivora TaxID=4796 RepID=A0A2P4YLC2_9STRA|nr:Hypothetical protein PHPALM_3852 [Phytophthora palmivora]